MKRLPSLEPVLTFLDDLRENNNKAWFDENRVRYDQARAAFEDLIGYFISQLGAVQDLGGVSPKDCIFRINRDIRFSKDKSPYKTHLAAEIAPGGKRSGQLGHYVHLAPEDGSIVAGGMYTPTSGQLGKFRQVIAENAAPFKRITKEKDFVRCFGSVEGDRLATAPQGYERDDPEIDLLRLKQVMVSHHFTDSQVLAPRFPSRAIQVMKAMMPFNDYLSRLTN